MRKWFGALQLPPQAGAEYPQGVKHLSVESLIYPEPDTTELQSNIRILATFLKNYRNEIIYANKRKDIFEINRKYIAGTYGQEENIHGLHRRLGAKFDASPAFEKLTGLMFSREWQKLGIPTSNAYRGQGPSFSVHSLHLASRVGPDGSHVNQIIVSLTQRSHMRIETDKNGDLQITPDQKGDFVLNGGCTLIFDLDTLKLRHAISKPLLNVEALASGTHQLNEARCRSIYKYQKDGAFHASQFQAYFGMNKQNSFNEPFSFLHQQ